MNNFYGDTSGIEVAYQARVNEPARMFKKFNGRTVCIVANGESVLENNYGPLVDMHDLVIRVNKFQIKGFEKHVGKRIPDVHAATNSAMFHSVECLRKFSMTVYCSDGFLKKEQSGHFADDSNLLFWTRPEGDYDDFLKGAWPTTGLRILLDVLSPFADARVITILGYDSFLNSRYYFDPLKVGEKPQVGPHHNPELEAEYINLLAARDERIVRL